MKLLWKLQLDNEPRQLHNLFPPLIVSDVQTAAGPEARSASSPASPTTSTASTSTPARSSGSGHFDNTFTEPGQRPRYYTLCPGGLTATPVDRPDATRRASSWSTRSRGMAGCVSSTSRPARTSAPPELFLPPNGKPYGLNLLQQRHLHDDRAGLRRQPEPVLQLRPRDEEGRQLQPGQRRPVAAPRPVHRQGRQRLRRQRRRRLLPRAQVFGQSIVAVKQNPTTKALEMTDWYTPSNAIWLRKRDLDMNVTGPVFDYKGKEYTGRSRARNAASGCSTPARSAARTIARRSIARRSSATRKCSSPPPGRGARSRPGRTPTARAGS